MYTQHFGLTGEPFSLTPDPDFLYLSAGHAEALAALRVGLSNRRGLIVMTGEVGTGKTTLLYALLRSHDTDMRTAYVANTALAFDDLLRLALDDFGLTPVSPARVDMLIALNHLLRDCAERDVTATLIIDEAQNLDANAFEQLRLLTNFETFTHKLLQIVLVGQPELEARLRQPSLRALAERVAVHCRLAPLDERESRAYLDHRLARVSGASRLFERDARDLLLAAAAGLPRRINILCDNALLFAYGRGSARVTRAAAELALAGRESLFVEQPAAIPTPARVATARPRRLLRLAFGFGAVALVVAIAAAELPLPALPLTWRTDNARAMVGPRDRAAKPVAVTAPVAPPVHEQVASAPPAPVAMVAVQPPPLTSGLGMEDPDHPADLRRPAAATVGLAPADAPRAAPVKDAAPIPVPEPAALPRVRTVRVERGSTLESLAREVYGNVDAGLIRRILLANPRVTNPNLILSGDLLQFPASEPGEPMPHKSSKQ